MTTTNFFYNKAFEIEGVYIPDFQLKSGRLVRIYISNISYSFLGFDLTIELIQRFQRKKPDLHWAKNYSQNRIIEYLKPLTVGRYLTKKMQIDASSASRIINEIGIKSTDKFDYLSFTHRKALIIKALFEKNDEIILDYTGISNEGISFLEQIVNSEIEKGKSAIAFDNLSYITEQEPFQNIQRIEITVPDTVKKAKELRNN